MLLVAPMADGPDRLLTNLIYLKVQYRTLLPIVAGKHAREK